MAKIVICSLAELEFADSLEWYSERSLETAVRFDEEISRAIETIANDPERFPICDDRHRRFVLRRFPFQIVYRLIGDEVHIVAFAHSSREPKYWSDR